MDKYIRIDEKLKKLLKIESAKKETSIKALAETYIRQGLKKEEKTNLPDNSFEDLSSFVIDVEKEVTGRE